MLIIIIKPHPQGLKDYRKLCVNEPPSCFDPTVPMWFRSSAGLTPPLRVCVLQVEVLEGCLKCPESGREFPISRGIPNMLLNEDEV